ncbi:MAG: hypothetical protein LC798_08850, partial [Chloroflexi bacterium]|nr:hypothetical protein [Chloroflexota bacterium]
MLLRVGHCERGILETACASGILAKRFAKRRGRPVDAGHHEPARGQIPEWRAREVRPEVRQEVRVEPGRLADIVA